jgi:hypothetical protein
MYVCHQILILSDTLSLLTACLSIPLYVGWHSPPLPARAAVSSARLDSTSASTFIYVQFKRVCIEIRMLGQ